MNLVDYDAAFEDVTSPWEQDDVDAEMGFFGSLAKAVTAPLSLVSNVGGKIGGAIGGRTGETLGRVLTGGIGANLLSGNVLGSPQAKAIGQIISPTTGRRKRVISLSGRTGMTKDGRLTDGASRSQPVPCACGVSSSRIAASETGISSSIPRLVKAKLAPELNSMRKMLRKAAVQREATSEHNTIVGRAEFQRRVLAGIASLEANRCAKKSGPLARFRAAFGF